MIAGTIAAVRRSVGEPEQSPSRTAIPESLQSIEPSCGLARPARSFPDGSPSPIKRPAGRTSLRPFDSIEIETVHRIMESQRVERHIQQMCVGYATDMFYRAKEDLEMITASIKLFTGEGGIVRESEAATILKFGQWAEQTIAVLGLPVVGAPAPTAAPPSAERVLELIRELFDVRGGLFIPLTQFARRALTAESKQAVEDTRAQIRRNLEYDEIDMYSVKTIVEATAAATADPEIPRDENFWPVTDGDLEAVRQNIAASHWLVVTDSPGAAAGYDRSSRWTCLQTSGEPPVRATFDVPFNTGAETWFVGGSWLAVFGDTIRVRDYAIDAKTGKASTSGHHVLSLRRSGVALHPVLNTAERTLDGWWCFTLVALLDTGEMIALDSLEGLIRAVCTYSSGTAPPTEFMEASMSTSLESSGSGDDDASVVIADAGVLRSPAADAVARIATTAKTVRAQPPAAPTTPSIGRPLPADAMRITVRPHTAYGERAYTLPEVAVVEVGAWPGPVSAYYEGGVPLVRIFPDAGCVPSRLAKTQYGGEPFMTTALSSRTGCAVWKTRRVRMHIECTCTDGAATRTDNTIVGQARDAPIIGTPFLLPRSQHSKLPDDHVLFIGHRDYVHVFPLGLVWALGEPANPGTMRVPLDLLLFTRSRGGVCMAIKVGTVDGVSAGDVRSMMSYGRFVKEAAAWCYNILYETREKKVRVLFTDNLKVF